MTAEEIEIIVTAKIEDAVKEFNKIVPVVKEKIKQVQGVLSKVDTREMKNKVQQAADFVKSKMQNIKKNSENSKITLNVIDKEAKRQITQLEKEIDSLQEKITGRQLKLDITNNALDKIRNDTNQEVINEIPEAGNKRIKRETYKRLDDNTNYQSLVKQSDKLDSEIEKYNALLNSAKSKMAELGQQISKTSITQNKLSGGLENAKQRMEQTKPSISSMKNSFNGIYKVTQNITNNIKNIGNGLKSGLTHVLKYATALFGLRSIYQTLSSSAQSWLSSQNAQAKQLSANIEYMKYAMGSVFAPVIEYVTSLVYNLMKAVQSLVYAFSGVNIFAKATASSMKNTSGSAKQASKSLSSVHSEINNVSDNPNSGSGSSAPNIDLSKLDNTSNSIIDAIKNGNWYEIGATIGKKLNDAMDSIPWNKIQNTARKIGKGIAQTLNGFIEKTNWKQVGNTFAQGINTAIYTGYEFVTTFNWKKIGSAISDAVNSFFENIDWEKAGQTLSKGLLGLLESAKQMISKLNWFEVGEKIGQFIVNIDWGKIILGLIDNMRKSILGGIKMIIGFGKEIVEGLFKGIGDALANIGQWIHDHIFQPFIDGFRNAFGIHSPSTVMEEQGHFIVEGLKNGLLGIWDKVKQPFIDLKNNITNKFTEIKNSVSNWANNTKEIVKNWGNNVKTKVSECWTNASNTVREKVTTLKNNISTGLNSAKVTVVNWGSNVKNTFTNLGRSASTWGKDLATNMATGIKNNIHKVTNAVTSVADKIKSFLHFTEPDEGPLSNFHTYMPDMIDLMVSGIKSNTNKIKSEMENLAGTMSYTINTEAVTGIPSTSPTIKPINVEANNMLDALSNVMAYKENENDKPIYLTVNVGNAKLGQILLDNLRDMKRQSGKDIEALVGG